MRERMISDLMTSLRRVATQCTNRGRVDLRAVREVIDFRFIAN